MDTGTHPIRPAEGAPAESAQRAHRERGLRAAHAANRTLAGRRRSGAESGWHRPGAGDGRLDAFQAHAAATLLERQGWRAEAVTLAQGVALVEVRDLAVRGHPKRATLRAPGEAEHWLVAHGHGLRGRAAPGHATPPPLPPPPPARPAGEELGR